MCFLFGADRFATVVASKSVLSDPFLASNFFVWPGHSYVHVFARHRRVKGVTLTRLPDLEQSRSSIRCAILTQFRSGAVFSSITLEIRFDPRIRQPHN
jgi:hypothetical protein